MARNTEQQKIYDAERYIGRKAAKLAREYVLARLSAKLHIHNRGDEEEGIKPILKATRVTPKMGGYRLLGLNFTTSKVGFIQHYGFVGVRAATTVLLSNSRYKKSATQRKSHPFKLSEKALFDDIYQKSGAFDYLEKALGDTRLDALEISLNGMIVTLNKEDGGQ